MTNPAITHTHGSLIDCTAAQMLVITEYKTVTMQAGGYVDCVAGDINLAVTDDAAAIGTLSWYNNTLRIWTIKLTTFPTVIAAGSVMDVTAGTGGGTSTGTLAALLYSDGDVLTLTLTPSLATDEYMFAEFHLATNISTSIYTKCKVRWKTSASINGCGLRILIKFDTYDEAQSIADNVTDGDANWIVGSTAPEYSTLWTVSTGTLTTAKLVDKVCIFADDDPVTIATGPHYVYVDFVLIYANDFTFPTCETSRFEPNPKYATIPIPGRVGDDTQNLGSNSAQWHCVCNLDLSNATDDWKRPQGTLTPKDDYIVGQVFDEIAHRSYTEPWQWLDTGNRQFKVTMENPSFTYEGEKHTLDLLFTEKRRRCGSNETYVERFGLNL